MSELFLHRCQRNIPFDTRNRKAVRSSFEKAMLPLIEAGLLCGLERCEKHPVSEAYGCKTLFNRHDSSCLRIVAELFEGAFYEFLNRFLDYGEWNQKPFFRFHL